MNKRVKLYIAKILELGQSVGIETHFPLIKFCVLSNSKNDSGHNLEHVYAVVKLGVELAEAKGWKGTRNMDIVFYGCLMHDMGCRWNRDRHHIESAELAEDLLKSFCNDDMNNEMIREIVKCCLEHRSSYAAGPSTEMSEVVALADRGKPDFFITVMRAFNFREKDGIPQHEMVDKVYEHLLDKYSETTGYNWKSYSKAGLELFAAEWAEFHRLMQRRNVRYLVDIYATQYIKTGKTKPVTSVAEMNSGIFSRGNQNRTIIFEGESAE